MALKGTLAKLALLMLNVGLQEECGKMSEDKDQSKHPEQQQEVPEDLKGQSESEKNSKDPCKHPRYLLQATVGGIVAAGLLAAWIIGYLKPILTAQDEVNKQQNKVALLQIEEKELYLSKAKDELKDARVNHQKELELIQRENRQLQDKLEAAHRSYEQLKKEYEKTQKELAQQAKETSRNAEEKARLNELAMEAQQNAEQLKAELIEIQKAQTVVAESETRLEKQLEKAISTKEQVMPISWVKPSDWLGSHYHLEIDRGIYLWPINLDSISRKAIITVNTSRSGRKEGAIIIDNKEIAVGEEVEFPYSDALYKLKLLSIRQAGKLPTDAGYFVAEKIK